jgi:hypothetical protein
MLPRESGIYTPLRKGSGESALVGGGGLGSVRRSSSSSLDLSCARWGKESFRFILVVPSSPFSYGIFMIVVVIFCPIPMLVSSSIPVLFIRVLFVSSSTPFVIAISILVIRSFLHPHTLHLRPHLHAYALHLRHLHYLLLPHLHQSSV